MTEEEKTTVAAILTLLHELREADSDRLGRIESKLDDIPYTIASAIKVCREQREKETATAVRLAAEQTAERKYVAKISKRGKALLASAGTVVVIAGVILEYLFR